MSKLPTLCILILAAATAGCASYGYDHPNHRDRAYQDRAYADFARAAYQIELASERWYEQTSYRAPRYVRNDAAELLYSAREFRGQIERGASPRQLRHEHAQLTRAYLRARDNLAEPRFHRRHHGASRVTPRGFREVEMAFYDLERLVDRYRVDGWG